MTTLTLMAQWLVNGVALGSVYALVALGFVTIYNVSGVLNLAQGEFLMLGALLTVSLSRGLPLPLAGLLAVLLTASIGAAVYALAMWPAQRASRRPGRAEQPASSNAENASATTLIMISIGVSAVLRGTALLFWGVDAYPLPPFSAASPLRLGSLVITRQAVWVVAITMLAVLLLALLFNRTMIGRALRACALNPVAARLMGVQPERMALLAFGLGAALAALGGITITPLQYAAYDMGTMLGLKGFVAAIIGGLSNPLGAIGGGLLLGVLEAVGGGISSAYKDAVAFVILVAVLLLRRLAGARGGK